VWAASLALNRYWPARLFDNLVEAVAGVLAILGELLGFLQLA